MVSAVRYGLYSPLWSLQSVMVSAVHVAPTAASPRSLPPRRFLAVCLIRRRPVGVGVGIRNSSLEHVIFILINNQDNQDNQDNRDKQDLDKTRRALDLPVRVFLVSPCKT